MSIMHLSIAGVPFSENGIAGILLMVSVTDADGRHYSGLKAPNFQVQWIFDGITAVDLEWVTVDEYRNSPNLPSLPGVYAVQLMSKGEHWSSTPANQAVFYVAVKKDLNRGQTLFAPDPDTTNPAAR